MSTCKRLFKNCFDTRVCFVWYIAICSMNGDHMYGITSMFHGSLRHHSGQI